MRNMTMKAASAISALVLVTGAYADDTNRTPGAVVDDAATTAGIKTRLTADADTKAHQINVETRNGIVQLNGFVDSDKARAEAERIASSAGGVAKVENNLQVRPADRSGSEVMDDAAITMKVDTALAADKRTSALRVDVETRQGEVQLSGFAKTAAEKAAAEAVAKNVDGVRTVSNKIDVR